ncbi:MAG: hypothetical protein HY020_11585 [Burkholderiales bacterium]|nr:hypothetical protein [Burkholderiales bacterium]
MSISLAQLSLRLPILVAALALASAAGAGTTDHASLRARFTTAFKAGQLNPQNVQSAARAQESGREAWQGRLFNELIIDHQRWMFSVPIGVSSANPEETGTNCGVNQQGPVWFLTGPSSLPTFSVSCTMPAGKPIFMPALAYFYEYPCPAPYPQLPPGQSLEAFLRAATAEFIDGISSISMTMDGKPIKLRRAATGLFPFTAAQDWVKYDTCITGAPQVALADGHWALIDAPSVGKHVINLKVSHPWLGSIDGTWNINVVK